MNVEEIIGKLRIKVNEFFCKDDSGHNTDHLERTLQNALYLQSKEGGDVAVIAVAAYIHDIHRILGAEKGKFVSPKESLPVARKFLSGLGLSNDQKNHILQAIEHHEEYSFGEGGVNVKDIESKIVQDADNLDAIGAVGTARTSKYYGSSHNVPDYDPNTPLYQNEFNEGVDDASTIHHMYNKLIRLGKHMNTKTARKMSKSKTKLMKNFLEMYINEVKGNF